MRQRKSAVFSVAVSWIMESFSVPCLSWYVFLRASIWQLHFVTDLTRQPY